MSDPDDPTFALAPGRIDVFLTFEEEIRSERLTQYEQVLSSDERARAQRLYRDHDRRQFVAAHALARTTLSRYFAVRPEAWRFRPGAYGRPEIAHNLPLGVDRISFNLAHTRGLVVMAVGCDRVIGVDVEKLDRARAAEAIARRFFAASEADALAVLPPGQRHERFFEYWTLKESHVKARGEGLACPLDSFSVDLAAEGAVTLLDPAAPASSLQWQFWQWHEAEDHVVAVCSSPPARPDTKIVVWSVVPMGEIRRHPVRFVRTSVSPPITDPKAPQRM
jgi:4'-phosphopantetheinyl transferase